MRKTNYIVKEYCFDPEFLREADNNIDIDINNDSHIEFTDNYYNKDIISDKYDYINENTLDKYITDTYENMYNNQDFTLTKKQYYQYLEFCEEHKDCLRDKNTGKHKFGTIGGGISLIYFPRLNNIYVICYGCNEIKKLDCKDIDIDSSKLEELNKKYDEYCKYNKCKLNHVEFYRLIEILNEYDEEDIELSFMGTGLGDIINVKTKEYQYDITDISNW